MRLGRFPQALEYADRSIALAPNVAKAHQIRSKCLKKLKRDDEARSALGTAVGLDPQNSVYRQELANELILIGRDAEAKEHYQVAVARTPSALQAHLRLCEVCLRLGELDEATAALNAAQRLAPGNPEVVEMARRVAATTRR
jgi:Flp pilus assembly protein TadD